MRRDHNQDQQETNSVGTEEGESTEKGVLPGGSWHGRGRDSGSLKWTPIRHSGSRDGTRVMWPCLQKVDGPALPH